MFKRFKKEKREKKEKIDYLSLTRRDKIIIIAKFSLKWGGIILLPEIIIMILIDSFTNYVGTRFFNYQLFIIPGALLIIGGCMGGLSRYNVPPKMRIVEPDDQAITPSDFQIRIRYDPNFVNFKTIQVLINDKIIPHKLQKEKEIAIVPKVFKIPPKKAISILLEVRAKDLTNRELNDKIRIICDPESDEEDYLEYWEFKREDDTYWGKEMIAASKHSRRNLAALKFIFLASILLLANFIVSVTYETIRIAFFS
ncbi:MAG: hypothetical protein KAS63_04160 [Candidatus Heimdallarchaeota archaeon]|nr:hypothetical protein [Candidatus Heimdallarchaeota archaeon]MCK4954529.1 hypothetical protein [Candidatus Heimdallarchaeota archaeon]